jgi:hypothetical protein
MPTTPTPSTVTPAVHLLSGALTRVLLEDDDEFRLGRFPADMGDRSAGLAAVRVLGADVLTPFILAGRALPGEDGELVRAAVRAYPAPREPEQEAQLWGVRDAALVRALAGLGVEATGWEGLAPARSPAYCLTLEWVPLALDLVRLAGAAPPFADAALHAELACRHPDIGRGLVRALLRRDLLSAARLTRWLTLGRAPDHGGLVTPALDHLEIVGADDPRVLLETAITRRMMTAASP